MELEVDEAASERIVAPGKFIPNPTGINTTRSKELLRFSTYIISISEPVLTERMTIGQMQEICRQLAGVPEDIKWNDHVCFNVSGKVFLITSPGRVPVAASFKVSDEIFEEWITGEGFMPHKYLARYKWVNLDDSNQSSLQQWECCVKQLYQLIAAKLPAKICKQIDI